MGKKITKPLEPDDMPKWISSFWAKNNYANVLAGINDDDCAVLKIGKETVVITVDYLNANPIVLEFKIGSYKELGRILVAANLSDLCGSGAKPVSFLVGSMFKKITATRKNFTELMKGIKYELNKYDIPLVGGDTKLGNSDNFFGIAIGVKEKNTTLFLKNKAIPGDGIWVSGNLGSVGAAISGLKSKTMPPDWNRWAKQRISEPNLPLILSRRISKRKLAKAGTDLSDGLGADLFSLCKSSGVGAIVNIEKIPVEYRVIEIASKNAIDPWFYPFTVGGDFQFLITANAKNDKKLKKIGLTKIGEIIKSKNCFILLDGKKIKMPVLGHRDSKSGSFGEEITSMLSDLNNYK